jgi:hypothetical protein
MPRVTLTVAYFASDPDGDLPNPMEMLAPAIAWLRKHGFVNEEDELVALSSTKPTHAYAIISCSIELRRPLPFLGLPDAPEGDD